MPLPKLKAVQSTLAPATQPMTVSTIPTGEGISSGYPISEPPSPVLSTGMFNSPIDAYLKKMSDGEKPYEPKDWRELLMRDRKIEEDF